MVINGALFSKHSNVAAGKAVSIKKEAIEHKLWDLVPAYEGTN